MRTMLPLVLLAACGPQHLKPEGADPDQLYIFHGSTIDEVYHDATVSLHQNYGSGGVSGPFCSGTLIFDRWVLTAAHCAVDTQPNDVLVHFGENGNRIDPQNLHTVRQVVVNPAYDDWRITNDVALLELSSPATYADPVMPLPASLGLSSADVGQSIDLAGFGFQENGQIGELLHVEVPIAAVRNTEIEYDQGNGRGSGSGGACNGDSGGPAFFERNGEVYLAGVTSYGDANCTDFGVSQKVDAFESFIESVTGRSVEPITGGGGSGGGSGTGGSGSGGSGSGGSVGGEETEVFTGSVSQGYLQPWKYKTLSPGIHDIVLEGSSGSDFDLYVAQKVNGQWVFIGQATSPTNVEFLTLDVPTKGTFAVAAAAYAGGGSYTIEITHPE